MSASASAPTAAGPREAALAVAAETLLNCYLREGGAHRFERGAVVLPLAGGEVRVGVRYRSPTLRHRFELPDRLDADALVGELSTRDPRGPGNPGALLERILRSAENVAVFLAARDGELDALWSADPLGFAASEQALLLGHPLHPTPKSRGEMSAAAVRAYSPETAARFPLRWLSVDPALVEHDSATGTPAPELAAALLGEPPGGRVLLPAHPWELERLRGRADVAALLESGAIRDLGERGGAVAPTTSVRTVYRAGWPWQLKFSLHLSVTNSMRLTLPKELRRAVESARLLQTEIGAAAARIAPSLVLLQDPAYLAVRHEGGLVDGLSVLLRENRWPAGSSADVSALAVLCQDDPARGRSRLARIVARLAERDGRGEAGVAREWFARYCDVLLVPIVRLYLELGLCLEPHQQNTLLELEGGWPARGIYRDSQGYFHREAAHADIAAILPGHGEESESIFPEQLADERLVYYPFVNNALGVVNALGIGGCVDERILLRDLRDLLERERARGGRYPATLLDRLLDDDAWPCKANLRTRLHDLDELVGDIAEQSIYVTIPNPLRA